MRRGILGIPACLTLAAMLFLHTATVNAQSMWTTAYYAGWQQGQYNNGVLPSDQIDYTALTHIIHFALIPQSSGSLDSTGNSVLPGNSAPLIAKAHAAGTKVIICIGGWATESAFMGATSAANLPKFVSNLIAFMRNRGYDGIDIDWEPLGSSDNAQFTNLINALRTAMSSISPAPLLTAAVTSQGALIASVASKLDRVQVMNYDLSGAYSGWVVWHNSPLYNGGIKFPGTSRLLPSTADMVTALTSAGVPAQKITIGIPFYGSIWSGGSGTSTGGATQPQQSWTSAPSVQQDVPYSTIMSSYYQPQYYRWDATAQVPYLSIDNSGSANDKFISYDDAQSVYQKAQYARATGLGGVFIWELGGGFRTSQPAGARDGLLQSVKQAMLGIAPPTTIDTVAPSVAFVTPGQGASVSGTVPVNIQATDNVGIVAVTLSVDGTIVGSQLTIPPYSVTWNSAQLANGSHVLTARAVDASGNISSTTETVTVSNLPPPAPTLSTPASGSTTTSNTQVQFSWSVSAGATSYRLQVATDPGFSNLVVNQTNITTVSFTVAALNIGVTYYWRVSASNAVGQGPYSSTGTFATPAASMAAAPALNSPANGATNVAVSAVLSWSASLGATSYHVVVSADAQFSTIVFQATNVSATNATVNGLSNSVTYYWRVSSVNQAGEGPFSSTRTFTTVAAPPPPALPAVPALSSPPDAAMNVPVTASLAWIGSSGATMYHLVVATDAEFAGIVFQASNLASTSTIATGLSSSTTYFWKVSAINSAGESQFSTVRTFTTVSSPPPALPPAPELTSPADGNTGIPLNVTLSWNAAPGATMYHLVVATDAQFAGIVYQATNLTATNAPLTGLTNNMTYYWKVSSINGTGEGAFSAVQKFSTASVPPAAPTAISPADGSQGMPLSLTLSWTAVAGATGYNLQVATTSDFSYIVVSGTDIKSTSYSLDNLAPYTMYFWRVSASNPGGVSPFSSTQRFLTGAVTSVELTSSGIPSDFSLSQNYPNPFNHETRLVFAIPEEASVKILIVDLLGQIVNTVVQADLSGGTYNISWDGSDEHGRTVASGMYLCTMTASGKSGRSFTSSKRVVLLK